MLKIRSIQHKMVWSQKEKEVTSMKEQRFFDQIMELQGKEELKEEVRRWEILAENIGRFPVEQGVLLPDYLWISGAGTGKSYVLRLLAQYLEARRIMDFSGDQKVIEFELGYCEPDRPFTELSRLISCISYMAGYRQRFRGIVAIHISSWMGHMKETYMRHFLEYLSENTADWLIVLVTHGTAEDVADAERQIAYYLRIKKLFLSLPEPKTLYEYLSGRCAGYGITLSRDAGEFLTKAIEVMAANPKFDGYNTLNLLAQDMIYELYSRKPLMQREITVDMLEEYGPEGSFVRHYREETGL